MDNKFKEQVYKIFPIQNLIEDTIAEFTKDPEVTAKIEAVILTKLSERFLPFVFVAMTDAERQIVFEKRKDQTSLVEAIKIMAANPRFSQICDEFIESDVKPMLQEYAEWMRGQG